MRQLISFEIDNALIKSIGETTEGTIIKLIDNSLIFVTTDKIGMFSRATLDTTKGDFSKVESTYFTSFKNQPSFHSNQVLMFTNTLDPYCASCHKEAQLVRHVEEIYPGRYITIFTSECCGANIVTWNRRPFPPEGLTKVYEYQQSWEVSDD